jgi:hypothetical protein
MYIQNLAFRNFNSDFQMATFEYVIGFMHMRLLLLGGETVEQYAPGTAKFSVFACGIKMSVENIGIPMYLFSSETCIQG